jgi:ferric-dicitrate binding protein FerR (iron transport regulator)
MPSAKDLQTAQQAAEWLAVLSDGKLGNDPETFAKFSRWCEESPRHRSAFVEFRTAIVLLDKTVDASTRHALNALMLLQGEIQTIPGTRLTSIARFVLTKEGFQRYVAPAIADMQEEYVEAVAKGDERHAQWIAIRGHLLVIPGWLYGFLTRAIKRIFTAQ